MPLTAKGEEIKSAMEKTYGKEKAERVLYASKNAGTISGIDALMERVDAERDPKEKEGGKYNQQAVERAIEQAERRGGKIGGEERRLIHALLKGRGDIADACQAALDACESLNRRLDAYCADRADAFAQQPAQDADVNPTGKDRHFIPGASG
jgi:hypothetical protein